MAIQSGKFKRCQKGGQYGHSPSFSMEQGQGVVFWTCEGLHMKKVQQRVSLCMDVAESHLSANYMGCRLQGKGATRIRGPCEVEPSPALVLITPSLKGLKLHRLLKISTCDTWWVPIGYELLEKQNGPLLRGGTFLCLYNVCPVAMLLQNSRALCKNNRPLVRPGSWPIGACLGPPNGL